jgi:hypothetical protein
VLQTYPLKRNLILRFIEEKSLRNNERFTDCGERRISGETEGELLDLSCNLFLLCVGDKAL